MNASESRPVPPAGRPPAPAGGARSAGALAPVLLLLAAAALVAPLVFETVAGPALRSNLLVELHTDPAGSRPEFSGAAEEAAAFYRARDTVAFTLPRSLSVAELLSIYHLGGHPGARAALREQAGARADTDVIPAGTHLVIPLTPSPERP